MPEQKECYRCKGVGYCLDPEKETHADHRHYLCKTCQGTGRLGEKKEG